MSFEWNPKYEPRPPVPGVTNGFPLDEYVAKRRPVRVELLAKAEEIFAKTTAYHKAHVRKRKVRSPGDLGSKIGLEKGTLDWFIYLDDTPSKTKPYAVDKALRHIIERVIAEA